MRDSRSVPDRPVPGPPARSAGRRARRLAWSAAYGSGAVGVLSALTWVLVEAEARLARSTIGEPRGRAPQASGSWGRARSCAPALHLAVLGDSSAAGLGCSDPGQTPGALLAGGLARELDRPVALQVLAVVGARSADLDPQVARALVQPVDVAVVLVGANDVTNRVPPATAARDLARAVETLRAAGAAVVVGTCPDLSTVEPLWQPLRSLAAVLSRRMARAQTVAVVEAGGSTVSLGDLLGPEFTGAAHLWSPDRFHPSAEGYARVADVLLPAVLSAVGADVAPGVPDSVQDVGLAAAVAARDPGLVVETVAGDGGAAAVGPGRLAWLRRLVPLPGRADPERTEAPAGEGVAAERG